MLQLKNNFISGAKVIPTPNKSGPLNPELIVVHDTAGNLDHMTSVSWLCNPQAKASAHFVVGRKGELVQLASTRVKTWHAGKSSWMGRQNVNDFAIGIEIANPGKLSVSSTNPKVARSAFGATYDIALYGIAFAETPSHGRGWWMPYTAEQLATVTDLCAALSSTYGIHAVAPHWEISPGRKIDTNPLFPLDSLRAKISGRKDADNLAYLPVGTVIRKWPSLFPDNVVATLDEAITGTIDRSGTFKPAGQDLPPEWLASPDTEIPWVLVTTPKASGWVIASSIRLL